LEKKNGHENDWVQTLEIKTKLNASCQCG